MSCSTVVANLKMENLKFVKNLKMRTQRDFFEKSSLAWL
jgi:hypothetical protein